MKCKTGYLADIVENKEYQDLNKWPEVTLKELLARLEGQPHEEVRIYTVASTRFDRNEKIIRHTGSGPNLEGGLATLCTCKHSMRQNQPKDWKNLWILGLTSRAADKGFHGDHYLFYMMKVSRSFETQKELFEYLKQANPHALRIKNAVNNPLGDIFEPDSNCINALNPFMYKTPHKNHSHGRDGDVYWHNDIVYNGRSAPLLLGDTDNTFVWTKPMIKFTLQRGVGNMKFSLGEELFSLLESVD